MSETTDVKPTPSEKPAARKIAILGNAQTSVHDAPFNDLSWKIWDMSANFQYGRRFDLWFEVHTPDTLRAYAEPLYTDKYFAFLKSAGQALIAGHRSEFWPDAQYYPLGEIMEHFAGECGQGAEDYFTCTFAYMVAFAIYQHDLDKAAGGNGVAEIGVWGVDMAVDEEYSHQKPCAEYWIGIARGRRIKVTVAHESPICRTNAPYAFDNIKLSREFTDRLTDIVKIIKQEETNYDNAKLVMRQHEVNLIELRAVQRTLRQICHKWAL